jgi:hypothetical protein
LSETGWSLDADPPESVNNEPINDRLGLEENSLPPVNTNNPSNNSNSNKLNNSRASIQASSFLPPNTSNKNVTIGTNKANNQSISTNNNDLINLNDDQVFERTSFIKAKKINFAS